MEKLQKALNKARKERRDLAPAAEPAVTPAPETVRAPSPQPADFPVQETTRAVPSIWEALTPYEPNPDLLLRHRIMTLNAQAEANPFDILRTKVFLMMRENGWKRLAITSPDKHCGKTTTACNLAVGFSRQREVRTMLFDLDLSRPNVATLMGHKPAYDIKDLLTGEVSARDQMVRLRTNVALSMARRPTHDPTQLLLSPKTPATFDSLQAQFEPDLMIFDLPPMLVTDITRAVLKNVDCALIVARAEQTKLSQLDICEREVAEHTNVLGVVLNNCRHLGPEEGYYDYYS